MQTVLEMKGITKRFKGVTALSNGQIVAKAGEIHTLMGENGAGKSTFLNIMSGAFPADSGEIFLHGKKVDIASSYIAKKMGIVKVHQEIQLIPELKVYENIFLGNELTHPKTRLPWFKKMQEESTALLKSLDADFSCNVKVVDLTIAEQQIVEIAKAILEDISLIILDEPTSSLTTKEIVKLFEIMRDLKAQGKAVIFVSHRFEEVFEISDQITVFKDGHYIDSFPIAETTKGQLVQLMTGRDISSVVKTEQPYDASEVVLSVRNLSGTSGKFRNVSFDLHKGEILGFAGLVGSGRTEIMRAVFGADRLESGEIFIRGNKVDIRHPRDAMQYGMALIPEDRKNQGIVPSMSNMLNASLCSLSRLTRGRILTDASIKKNAEKFMKMLGVRPFEPAMNTENLSGGNQQKIVLAKWLSIGANIIIMDEPTRGIDVGAKDEIYKLMLSLIEQGASIIMVSSELPEVLSMSHNLVIMHEGNLVHKMEAKGAEEEKVLHYAMGLGGYEHVS